MEVDDVNAGALVGAFKLIVVVIIFFFASSFEKMRAWGLPRVACSKSEGKAEREKLFLDIRARSAFRSLF